MADGKAFGAGAPPQMVGLLGHALQHRRLHLPAILAAVGRAGHGHGAVDQRPAFPAVCPAARLADEACALGRDDGGGAGPAGRVSGGGPLCGRAPASGAAGRGAEQTLGQAALPAGGAGGAPRAAGLPGGGAARAHDQGGKRPEHSRSAVALRHRGLPRRRGGDPVLPGDGGRLDEPLQSGVGAFQRGVGAGTGAGHRAAAQQRRKKRQRHLCLWRLHGRCLRVCVQRRGRATVWRHLLGLQRLQVQHRGPREPAVLLFLGHCGGGLAAEGLPAGGPDDERPETAHQTLDDGAAGGVHGCEHDPFRPGAGPVRQPHQRHPGAEQRGRFSGRPL